MLFRTAIAIIASAATLTALVSLISGAWRAAALGGAMALAGATLGLFLFHRAMASRKDVSVHRRTNRLMAAFVATMLTRLVLLASSLAVLLLVLGWEPLVFVSAFFLVHLVSQVIEIRYVHRSGHRLAFLTP